MFFQNKYTRKTYEKSERTPAEENDLYCAATISEVGRIARITYNNQEHKIDVPEDMYFFNSEGQLNINSNIGANYNAYNVGLELIRKRAKRDIDHNPFSASKYLFENLILSKKTDFKHFIFHKEISFKDSVFEKDADFSEAEFQNRVSFENCIFEGDVDFQKVKFNRRADFTNCLFIGNADFRHTTFNKYVYFGEAEFEKEIDFINAEFKNGVLFKKSCFVKKPPRFFGTKLHEGTAFFNAIWPLPANKDEANDFIGAYERLKKESENQKKHIDELLFFSLEMRARQKAEGLKNGWVNALYGLASDYGRSLLRPLASLGVVILLGFILHFIFTNGFGIKTIPSACALRESFLFSADNSLHIIKVFHKELSESLFGKPKIVGILLSFLSGFLALAGFLCIFLFGLAIRNRFRLK